MKRIILLVVLIAIVAIPQASAKKKNPVIRTSKESITFVVDEELEAPTALLPTTDSEKLNEFLVNKFSVKGAKVYGSSFDNTPLVSCFSDDQIPWNVGHAFIKMVCAAYADHRPLSFSPDDIWLLISQGIAEHIKSHAEELREKLVNHEGKILLSVTSDAPLLGQDDSDVLPDKSKPVDWSSIFSQFETLLKENTKGEIVSTMTANFSTTTPTTRIVSQITVMKVLEHYFTYEVNRMACGIPYITLKGTAEDWQKILDKTRCLEQYELGWWSEELIPVLEQFVKTAQGKPDQQFWRCMVTQIPIDEIIRPHCGGGGTEFDGWISKFFPYTNKGERTNFIIRAADISELPSEAVSVDFIYRVEDAFGNTVATTPMKFVAGFMGGAEQDEKTFELTPHIGWQVSKATKTE